jgi:hypothetical protein
MKHLISKRANRYLINVQKMYSFRNMRKNLTQSLPCKKKVLDKS